MLLYLHGFRSSPESFKARLLGRVLADRGLAQHWQCPQLPASPAAAMALALHLAGPACAAGDPQARLTVIGSSLGGFYAAWLAERLGCRAVLINPVVHAARDLATQVGSHRTFHGDAPFEFLPAYVGELAQAEREITQLTRPERYLLLAATGDEVLDWHEMTQRFAASAQRVIEGSDHGLSGFATWLPEVLAFALGAQRVGEPPAAGGGQPCVQVEVGPWLALAPEATRIRTEVFVHEQHVPPAEELDARDAGCLHALARDAAGRPVATGRLLPDGHIGRMAVERAWRGRGAGSLILHALMAQARRRGDAEVVLAAQLQARPFYARHGFVEEGATFMDAGIPHRLMRHRFRLEISQDTGHQDNP